VNPPTSRLTPATPNKQANTQTYTQRNHVRHIRTPSSLPSLPSHPTRNHRLTKNTADPPGSPLRNHRLSLHLRPLHRNILPTLPNRNLEQQHNQHDPASPDNRIRARGRNARSRPGRGQVQVRGQQHDYSAPVGSRDARQRRGQREGGEQWGGGQGVCEGWEEGHAQRERGVLEQ